MITDQVQGIFEALKKDFEPYLLSLDGYTDEKFQYKHDAGTWSLAQMYEHICSSSVYFFMANVVRCLEKRKGQEGGEYNQYGANIFKYNGFPPMKFKVPGGESTPEPIAQSKEMYRERIEEIIDNASLFVDKIAADEQTYKTEHPVFGWLNALEWFQNLEMHTRHHLRQKAELEAFAKNKS